MADVIDLACPECGKTLHVPAAAAGKKVRCKSCGAVIPVAADAAARNAPPPTAKSPASRPRGPRSAMRSGDPEDDGKPYALTSMYLGARCPECANEMGDDDVVCLVCGYHLYNRARVETKKVADTTGFDVFMHLLPGILFALLVFSVVLFNVLFLVFVGEWFSDDSWYAKLLRSGFVKVWLVVLSGFVVFFAGRFAIRRLIFNPQPPEVELR